jgi:hypothetical protein
VPELVVEPPVEGDGEAGAACEPEDSEGLEELEDPEGPEEPESGADGALDGVATGAGATEMEAVALGALAAAVVEEPELEPESEPELESPSPPKVGVPVQASEPSAARLEASPRYSMFSPGWGKRISTPSLVVQPLTLATNMGGKLEERLSKIWVLLEYNSLSSSTERLEELPETVMGAQFMYISRFPIRLNQVQARVYFPAAMPSGILKLKVSGSAALAPPDRLPSTLAGQPPSKDLITFHSELLEGCRSVVKLIWQEPPPWVALPTKVSGWDSPIPMTVSVSGASKALSRSLQGKSLPSAARGELLRESLL